MKKIILKRLCAYGGLLWAAGMLCGCAHYLVFTTETKFGLDISQSANQDPQITMGYERAAIVSMPVAKGTNDIQDAHTTNDAYSVIGTFNVRYRPWLTSSNSGIRIMQLFATGPAAQALATNTSVASIFGRDVAEIYLTKYADTNK